MMNIQCNRTKYCLCFHELLPFVLPCTSQCKGFMLGLFLRSPITEFREEGTGSSACCYTYLPSPYFILLFLLVLGWVASFDCGIPWISCLPFEHLFKVPGALLAEMSGFFFWKHGDF